MNEGLKQKIHEIFEKHGLTELHFKLPMLENLEKDVIAVLEEAINKILRYECKRCKYVWFVELSNELAFPKCPRCEANQDFLKVERFLTVLDGASKMEAEEKGK